MTRAGHVPARRRSFTQRRLLVAPLSPVGLALISYSIFVGATVFPPHIYERVMAEPDGMFLNPGSTLFVTLCVLGYMAGVFLMKCTSVGVARCPSTVLLRRTRILAPLVVALVLNMASVFLITKHTPDLFTAWLGNGAAAKQDLNTTNTFSQALPVLYAVCWWAMWRLFSREQIKGSKSIALRWATSLAFAVAIGTAVIKVARYDLMPMIFGSAFVYLTFKLRDKQMPTLRYCMFVCAITVAVVALFVVFSWLRGSNSQSILLNNVMGYTIASYNRLAGLLAGHVRFPFGGSGTYIFGFLGNFPLLGRWVHFSMPDPTAVWLSEFSAVSAGGLDGAYIWGSAFGYVYADIGWAAPLYFLAIGALVTWAWRRLQAGRVSGILLYPWLGFSVLFWFGSNIVAYPQLVTLSGLAGVLSIYERLAAKRARIRYHGALANQAMSSRSS